ncbi:serine/threonine-protein kinase [Actinomadura sp. WMMA1423]|uniref:serine/threonine-protein kinase n=1 Tax=Actinomadura sp. WMMA1423 TaxID=2591108 RepID=UPI00114764BE|nr:serine/threonine-protein kinase [Actinomadura sp. WMMA1423]
MSGWRVPGYTELGELGTGAHGRVVLARRDGAGALVAIKYVDTSEGTAPRLPSDHEARLMASVDHPNVVRLHDLVRGGTGVALVMEAVEGVSLARVLKEHTGLEPEAALTVLKGSLLGLAAAHAAGVVHRDYKPDNVIVGDDGASKLIDFGVASVSGDRSVAGTAAYMAPEQCNGDPAGPAADVYAATGVFVECVAGRPPYRGDRGVVLMAQHLHAPIPADLVPRPLRGLVTHGMAKSPAERPPSAAEFVRDLEAVAVEAYGEDWERRGLAALAAAAPALMRGAGAGAAQAGTTIADTAIGGGAGSAGAGAAAFPVGAAAAKDVAADQARRSLLPGLAALGVLVLVLIGSGLFVLRADRATQAVADRRPRTPHSSAPPPSSPPSSPPKPSPRSPSSPPPSSSPPSSSPPPASSPAPPTPPNPGRSGGPGPAGGGKRQQDGPGPSGPTGGGAPRGGPSAPPDENAGSGTPSTTVTPSSKPGTPQPPTPKPQPPTPGPEPSTSEPDPSGSEAHGTPAEPGPPHPEPSTPAEPGPAISAHSLGTTSAS